MLQERDDHAISVCLIFSVICVLDIDFCIYLTHILYLYHSLINSCFVTGIVIVTRFFQIQRKRLLGDRQVRSRLARQSRANGTRKSLKEVIIFVLLSPSCIRKLPRVLFFLLIFDTVHPLNNKLAQYQHQTHPTIFLSFFSLFSIFLCMEKRALIHT